MKRLVLLGVVALLVVTAGCGTTSQAVKDAQKSQTTTSDGGSSPADTAPVGAMLPEPYSMTGLEDPERAYELHMDALANTSYQVKYSVRGAENDSVLYYAYTNVSAADQRWRAWIVDNGSDGRIEKQLYQEEDTRWAQVRPEHGTNTTERSEVAFAAPEGTYQNRSLETLLKNIEISSPQASQSGHEYITFSVDSYRGQSVDQAHLFVFPSGRIWGLMITLEDRQILYIAAQSDSVSVNRPAWAGNATVDS